MGKRMVRAGKGRKREGKWEVGRVDKKEGWMAMGGWRQGDGIWKGATGRERWGGEQ